MKRALLLVMLASCTPGPAPVKPPRPHPQFPIEAGVHAAKCTACHPITVTTYSQFQCTGCHEDPKTTSRHPGVGGYVYASGSCYGCHPDGSRVGAPRLGAPTHDPSQDVQVTALVPAWSATSIVGVTPADESLPMTMNHDSAMIAPEARAACSNCHPNSALRSFYPGQLHGSLQAMNLPQPTGCSDCHAAAAPQGFVGALAAARTPPTGEMKHDAVAWDGGGPTGEALVTRNCGVCHSAPSVTSAATWKTGARFHPAVDPPGSCLDCHANTRPGLLTSANAALPPQRKVDHSAPVWLGDCVGCHRAGFASWAGGKFHLPNAAAPSSCLPCHDPDRPTSADGGMPPPPSGPPFDFVTNAQGITHGAGQDCAGCHASTQAWSGGSFGHGPGTLAATTCVACHSTQRPTAVVSGFDHAQSGTGDCFGCHANTADWAGGKAYPGTRLISSTTQFVQVTQLALKRGGPNNLVTGTTATQATLYNAMLHTSAALSADAGLAPGLLGDMGTCWHCHTSTPGTTTVTAFRDGKFHAALAAYRVAPTAPITALPQPSSGCTDCHAGMRPKNIVQRSSLKPMDHDAKGVDGGTVLSLLDCSTCHADPGGGWDAGVFHPNFPGAAQLDECTTCHYPLMADAAKVDVISTASPTYKMQHRSPSLTFQRCDRCHPTALAQQVWAPGKLHPNLPAQPTACLDCHGGVTTPQEPTPSAFKVEGDPQWMNHLVAAVAAKDCAFCHAADAKPAGGKWSPSTVLHRPGLSPSPCKSCHGAANGGPSNNVPPGLVDSATNTSASVATGVAGVADQLSHADVNVTARDCAFCHAPGDAGWAAATFHPKFTGGTALVMNGTTGRCSNCHLNVKPLSTYTPQHAAFSATSATDCSSCHQWPGTGTQAAPNWHRSSAVSAPQSVSVGGFTIAQPPASNATTTQAGVSNLAHPAVATGTACTTCHAQSSGGRGAFGYDHALAPATGCAACHEAGSDLVGTPWTLNAAGATAVTAQCGLGSGTVADRGGDTRPIGIASLACSASAAGLMCGGQSCSLNHFYPSDCGECHLKPAAVPATVQTGSNYVGNWKFQHFFGTPAQQATCCHCHAPPSCRG